MRLRHPLLIMLSTASLALCAVPGSLAQTMGRGAPHAPNLAQMVNAQEHAMAQKLHLSSSQVARLHSVDQKYIPILMGYQGEGMKMMMGTKPGHPPDQKAIAKLQAKIQGTGNSYKAAVNAILTPAQRKQLQAIQDEQRKRVMQMMQQRTQMMNQRGMMPGHPAVPQVRH